MKAALYFRLDDPEDAMAHFRCIKSADLALMVFEFQRSLHNLIDTSEDGQTINGNIVVGFLDDYMCKFGIDLDELIS
jgi:hypothetical protein